MLIKFEIQLDDNGTASVTQAQAAVNPNAPAQKQLGQTFVAPAAAASARTPAAQKGGDAPVDGPGSGTPTGSVSSSGSGVVVVLGPIVICGSGPGHTGPGGDAPVDGPGTGGPPAGNNKAGA
jgi:hypothetical protein